jgi:type 2 lantibiotic biosynthesis protein LanM
MTPGPNQHALAAISAIAQQYLEPVVAQVRRRACALAADRSDLPFDPEGVVELARPELREALVEVLARPVALELHVARLTGTLEGETPERRFDAFAARLGGEHAAAFLDEYPVLVRQLELSAEHWGQATAEFLCRLADDWPDIRADLLTGEDPGCLTSIEGGAGDKHRQGRSVVIVGFQSGAKVVYKPRSLAVDQHFQELLRWLDETGNHPPFRTLRMVDRGTHGWVEFVHVAGCASDAQVRRFYRRQGAYLALLHAFCAVDFHHENLVAAGEHPVLVDLESLFHPELFDDGDTAETTLRSSVLAVGLLPSRVLPEGTAEGIDVSGLGAVEGAVWPREVPRWENVGTDQMRMTPARVSAATGTHHRPTLDGATPNLADYADEVMAGFTSMYELIRSHRADLLAPGGPLASFAADEVRVIVRPTQAYRTLLRASLHPDFLRSAQDRAGLLDKLSGQVEVLPVLGRFVAAEQADLSDGDIPFFSARPASRHLWTSRGDRLDDVLVSTGLQLVARRVDGFDADDLARQRWFIAASFASLAPSTVLHAPTAPGPTSCLPRNAVRAGPPSSERLVALARVAGERLAAAACREDGACSWIAVTLSREGRWMPAPLDSSLYGGVSGVALFLAELASLTAEDRFAALAHEALGTLRRRSELDWSEVSSIGALQGWGGIIYVLARLAGLWDAPALVAEAEAVVARLPALIEDDEVLDLYGGAAGCIMGLLALHAIAPSERTLQAAVACGDRLLACARRMNAGIGWVSSHAGGAPLTGLSHGAAGIAMALADLAGATGRADFRSAAHAALAYERSLFNRQAGNWADLRALAPASAAADEPRFKAAICHGAPGIGLARLHMLRHGPDPAIALEIDAAVEATLRPGWGSNHSLCHGDLGNLEVVLEASLADVRWHDAFARTSAAVVADVERRGFLCPTPDGLESPELMTGVAGIGYALLRLAAPSQVPSVLALRPPAGGPRHVPSFVGVSLAVAR